MEKNIYDDHSFRDSSGSYTGKLTNKLSLVIVGVLLLLLIIAGTIINSQQMPAGEAALRKQIMAEMQASGIPCIDARLGEDGCAWVVLNDNTNKGDGLAARLCATAKQYGAGCVSIKDSKGNRVDSVRCQ